jgi:chromosome segregation ATPase
MKNKLFLAVVIASIAFSPLLSNAEEGSASVDANIDASINKGSPRESEARIKAREDLEIRKKELEQKRETMKADIEAKRETMKAEIDAKKDEIDEKKDTIKAQIEERRQNIKSEVEERKSNAVGVIKERIGTFTQNVIKRFNAAIERLDTLAGRIDSRIAKIEAEGGDTAKAKELMAVAKTQLETAKISTSGVELEVKALISVEASTTAEIKDEFDSLKDQIEKAKGDIKKAHSSLIEVINSLKKVEIRATTTASTTPSN